MGDYNHPVVVDLRMFRDNWLLKRNWGVQFTNWYYTHGPKIHKWSCGHCHMGFGKRINAKKGENGVWIGPFDTLSLLGITFV